MLKDNWCKVIVIIDYGAGNIRSVVNAISRVGYQAKVTNVPDEVLNADAVILPGVGTAADIMVSLRKLRLVDTIRRFIAGGRPFLGVCIGMQILFSATEEGGWHECLGIITGIVRRLPQGLKIPHMGWNQVRQRMSHPIFSGIPSEADFYFVHSYFVETEDSSLVAGETVYGLPFCSVLTRGNLVATQFHPEKSGEFGLKFYDNFIKISLAAKASGLKAD